MTTKKQKQKQQQKQKQKQKQKEKQKGKQKQWQRHQRLQLRRYFFAAKVLARADEGDGGEIFGGLGFDEG